MYTSDGIATAPPTETTGNLAAGKGAEGGKLPLRPQLVETPTNNSSATTKVIYELNEFNSRFATANQLDGFQSTELLRSLDRGACRQIHHVSELLRSFSAHDINHSQKHY